MSLTVALMAADDEIVIVSSTHHDPILAVQQSGNGDAHPRRGTMTNPSGALPLLSHCQRAVQLNDLWAPGGFGLVRPDFNRRATSPTPSPIPSSVIVAGSGTAIFLA